MTTESQNKRILEHLSLGRTITSLEALSLFGCFRLAARISDLKYQGLNVKTEMIQVGNNKKKVARYSLKFDDYEIIHNKIISKFFFFTCFFFTFRKLFLLFTKINFFLH